MSGNGKYFRPPPASAGVDSDDSDDDNNNGGNRNNNGKRNLSSSESESDDEDEQEQAPVKQKSSKKGANKKSRSSSQPNNSNFFDEEAEVDDSGDESVYGAHHDPHDVVKKHYSEEDIQREYQGDDFNAMARQIDRRRKQAQGGNPYTDNGLSAEEVAREIENRHIMSRRTVDRDIIMDSEHGGGLGMMNGASMPSAVSQQSLLPTVGKDPSLWMFSCANGKEQELVLQIMNKCIAFANKGTPLGITSAVAAQSKGKVYVESFSEPAVIQAVQGIRNVMGYSMRLIPLADMTTVMTVVPKKKPVHVNDWVRMTRGHFKGDLAMVKDVRHGGLKCVVQCVPRIDLTLKDLTPEEARIRRRTVRPAQKFFNSIEMTALKFEWERVPFPGGDGTMCDKFEGNFYFDGYMLKEVTVGTMIKACTDDDPPTLDELQRFRQRKQKADSGYDDGDDPDGENEASKRAGSLLDELSDFASTGSSKAMGGLIIGDTVEVTEGDLIGMRGKLVSMDGDANKDGTVKIKPDNTADLGGMTEVEFLSSQVRKHIAVGAHVKVTCGRYANETGTVVAVEQLDGDPDFTAVMLTDMTHREVSVRVSQLQESAEIASGQDRLAGYELHDLVVLTGGGNANEVGVIVRVGREEFTVMNHHGIVREVRPEELRGKRNSSSGRAVALDVQGNQIRVGDSVSVAEGPHKGKTATIKRMNRAQLFLYSQTRQEHAGIFVVRSRSCVLAGSNRNSNSGNAQGGSFQSRGGPRGGAKEDSLLQKTVRIQSGKWKGYMGCVSDATPTHVQVELHSRLKKIMVLRERVAVVGDRFGATDNPDRSQEHTMIGAPTTPFLGASTPMHTGGATPMHHGGATPMHEGGFTPSHSGGNESNDVWRPESSDTGSVTSGWGSSTASVTATDGGGGGSSHNNNNNDDSSDLFSTNTTSDSTNGGGWGASATTNNNSNNNESTWTPSTNGHTDRDSMSTFDSNSENNTQSQDTYTPSSNSNNTPSVGEHNDSSGEVPVWFMERVCVAIKGGGGEGTIREIQGNVATVNVNDTTKEFKPSELTLIQPKEHDTVLVTGGADVGVEGELVCIDGTDAILKDSSEDYKIVDFVHLAKIQE